MTEIHCRRQGNWYRISIVGHAGFAKDGEPDIVCAAVSALACTLLRCLADLEEQAVVEAFSYRQEAGDVRITAQACPDVKDRVCAAVDTVMTGFMMVANEYPGCVRVEREDV